MQNKAKVKLRNNSTGQEYLLLVLKINLKGLLVNFISDLGLGDSVELFLNSPDDLESIKINGAVHKIVSQPNGNKGTIIRFISAGPDQLEKLHQFIQNIQLSSTTKTPAPIHEPYRPGAKTMVVPQSDLSHLALESPDREADYVPSTLDEEDNLPQGLSGHTMIAKVEKKPKKKSAIWKTIRQALIILGVLLTLGLLFTTFYNNPQTPSPLQTQIPQIKEIPAGNAPQELIEEPIEGELLESQDIQEPQELQELQEPQNLKESPDIEEQIQDVPPTLVPPTPIPAKPTKKPAPSPKKIRTQSITNIHVRDSGAFLKIRITGAKNNLKNTIEKTTSPQRLNIEFLQLDDFRVPSTISVSKSPLLRIKTKKLNNNVRVTLELYPGEFPRYNVQQFQNYIDVFLYK